MKNRIYSRRASVLFTALLTGIFANACTAPEASLKNKIQGAASIQNQYQTGGNSINFGVVLHTPHHQIYRAHWLGKKGLKELKYLAEHNQLPFPKTIVYMNRAGYKGLYNLAPSAFYGGDFALEEYELQKDYGYRFLHSFDYKNRTYLDGVNPFNPSQDIDSQNRLNKKARKIFGPYPPDGVDGDTADFRIILEQVLDTANQPVLFHCWAGRHRTGMIAMAIRYIQGGIYTESFEPILFKKDSKGKPFQVQNLAQLEYLNYTNGPKGARGENVRFIERWVKSETFARFVRQYRAMVQ